jgi:ATP-dependent helicase/nuclease subunit B
MDATIVAAIEAGRSIIVPDAQCAAALRLGYARYQQARGCSVWQTPDILPWDAYLAQQLRKALASGRKVAAHLLLSRSQERAVWEQILDEMGNDSDVDQDLRSHVGLLQRAAQRASQSVLPLERSAITEEEQLLASAVARFRARCAERGWLSLRLALPAQLDFLEGSFAPLFVGQMRLTALQSHLIARHWPVESALVAVPTAEKCMPSVVLARDLQQEWACCAAWCREQLALNPASRLLVITAYGEWSLSTQSGWLWREFAARTAQQLALAPDPRYLAVEGGQALSKLPLISDALNALRLLQEQDSESVAITQLLLSPYFRLGQPNAMVALEYSLRQYELARWPRAVLHATLGAKYADNPAAAALAAWLGAGRSQLAAPARRSAGQWAAALSLSLQDAGFATQRLHSSEQQRLNRWQELLDEFAALDAVAPALTLGAALSRIGQLAETAQHQAASSDAAITLSRRLSDPVAQYDGIYVVGLSETRWPEPPRPDPFVAAEEQRKHAWPESNVTQRLAQAQWSLSCWQARTSQLVLSYAAQEGDITHRPSALLAGLSAMAKPSATPRDEERSALGSVEVDEKLPPLVAAAAMERLSGGMERLRLQQVCAFRAQAQYRLGAVPMSEPSEGINPALRGRLLHALFESLWRELASQAQLATLDATARSALFARHWRHAVQACAIVRLQAMPARVMARERQRAQNLWLQVLALESQRPPFTIEALESELPLHTAAGAVRLRVDRLDVTPDGTRVLVDYKTGGIETIALQEGIARPLQLAVYCMALAAQQLPVRGALFLSLKPGALEFVGAADPQLALPKPIKPAENWDSALQSWQTEVLTLVTRHLAGDARVEPSSKACKHCHLPALCRKSNSLVEDPEAAQEDA